MTLQQQATTTGAEIETGLDFILSHISGPVFPRRISTYESKGRQFTIDSKDEVLTAFRDSKFKDCRISAFPLLREGKSWIPDLLFIDLDLQDFSSRKILDLVLSKTLRRICRYLGPHAIPTVLWSGNGYHVIQPVECPVTEYVIKNAFLDLDNNPSEQFLRFAKTFLSDNKADKNHNPSFRSCLLRVPGSINSKNNSRVKIIQKWNQYRPAITKELFIEFKEYLIQKKIDQQLEQERISKEIQQRRRKQEGGGQAGNNYDNNNDNNMNINYYQWIDQILEIGLEDCRKLILSLILAPYLINIKKLSHEESFNIIKEWLDKCDTVNKLADDSNFDYRISHALKRTLNKGIGPMSREKIKIDNTYEKIHILLNEKGIL